MAAKHTAELQNLRRQLHQQHQAELNRVREEARAAAAGGQTGAAQENKALEEKHSKEIEEARESGRIEYQMKVKLKDSQLTKASNRVKALELKIQEWETSGVLPPSSLASIGTAAAAKPAAQATTAAPAKPAASAPATQQRAPLAGSSSAPAGNPAGAPAAQAGLPRRPAPASGAAPAGVGRGGQPVVRGQAGRGRVQPGGAGRGASRPLPIKSTPTSGGVSIMGAAAAAAQSAAASKRPRDDSDTGAQDDSLAKRLKSVEPQTSASGTPAASKPVQLRRPPPPG